MGINVLTEYKQHNDFLIEQVKEKNKENNELRQKLERYEKALKRIVDQTSCDDTWDFANRVLEGKPNNDLFYRINID